MQFNPTKKREKSSPPMQQKWVRPPDGGLLKVNCDGSFFLETKKGDGTSSL
jgi:hypothetical protein